MATCEHTSVVRWTPRRINAAFRCPKPTGAIARFHAAGTPPRPAKQPLATAIAAFIARHADLIAQAPLPTFEQPWTISGKPCGWLLVPATTWLVDALSEWDAEHEDCEPDADSEPESDNEPDDQEADQADEEHSEARPDNMDRSGLPEGGPDLVITAEQRLRYREGGGKCNAHREKRRVSRWLASR
ncbi:hypothetical protein [uncultured Reyranella sp.]|jgi:hypothetical protein|uniref:hypothetical protein n=1 Tax=uncultured Reyranella sp. TaxID=735512 RepID=UPI00259CACFF|nr:hypothetical protein [uncultured Reyranella sp.]